MSLTGREAARSSSVPGGDRPRRRVDVATLILVAIVLVPLVVLSIRSISQFLDQRSAYRAGYSLGERWRTIDQRGNCYNVASKTYVPDSSEQLAFQQGCEDGVSGSPAEK